jgi:hypothetical protein
MQFRLIVSLFAFFVCTPALSAQDVPRAEDTSTATKESKVSCSDNKPSAKPLPPASPACEEEVLRRRGRPFMFPPRNGIAFGVSSEPDKPSSLNLWADNQTEKPVSIPFCCASTIFEFIEIFDSAGHRVPSRWDQLNLKTSPSVCTCSGDRVVSPHTIQIVDFADVSMQYSLQPGRYTISERGPPSNALPDKLETSSQGPPGLSISIP